VELLGFESSADRAVRFTVASSSAFESMVGAFGRPEFGQLTVGNFPWNWVFGSRAWYRNLSTNPDPFFLYSLLICLLVCLLFLIWRWTRGVLLRRTRGVLLRRTRGVLLRRTRGVLLRRTRGVLLLFELLQSLVLTSVTSRGVVQGEAIDRVRA